MKTLRTKLDVENLTLQELRAIGSLEFWCSDLDKPCTIKDYFLALLIALLAEREGFSGKRPFGDSAWIYDLYTPLVIAGFVEGTVDEEGVIDYFPSQSRDIADLILIEVAANL